MRPGIPIISDRFELAQYGVQRQRKEPGMRFALVASVCLGMLLAGSFALADLHDLSGGVFIAHAPPGLQYTNSPPSGSWCSEYMQNHAIASCEDQDNEIESQGMAVWYVLSAWNESKEWCGAEFGLGDYDEQAFVIELHGPCFPISGLSIPGPSWPGPNAGIALTTTDTPWSGNFQPVYWFAGYVYAEDVIPLSPDPASGVGGWTTCEDQEEFEAVDLGGMGLLTDGIHACPPDSAIYACCVQEACYLVSEQECASINGTCLHEVSSCSPNRCSSGSPPPIPCCADHTCIMLSRFECIALGGIPIPDRQECSPDTCPDGVPTGHTTWSAVKAAYRL
jgi:hypothetical protein